MRIQVAENDEIIGLLVLLKKGPRIVVVYGYAGRSVGPFGVNMAPNLQNERIDLDCVNVLCAMAQSGCDIVSRSGSNDQNLVRRIGE